VLAKVTVVKIANCVTSVCGDVAAYICSTDAVKYLRLHFDCRLNGKEHIARKIKQTDLKTREINWLLTYSLHAAESFLRS